MATNCISAALPLSHPKLTTFQFSSKERVLPYNFSTTRNHVYSAKEFNGFISKKMTRITTRCSDPSSSDGATDESSNKTKVPFGYSRKDVIFIGLGVTFFGIGLKSGLEYYGVDPLQAGNVVQLVLVLGLTVGWISTYLFRVSNKEMTYAQQLRDYETKVMEKRLEGLSEAELEALLEQVEEEKRVTSSNSE
nr:inactive receptor-like protein kinase [Tanacetum cinerariifolium]